MPADNFGFELRDVKFYAQPMDRLLNQRNGDVGQWLNRKGAEILVGAQAMAGQRSGRLRKSLYLKWGRFARGQYVEVGAKVSYAYYHHEGTKPHVITGRGVGHEMVFNSGGRRIYARRVLHPGTKPNRFLTVPLRRVLGR